MHIVTSPTRHAPTDPRARRSPNTRRAVGVAFAVFELAVLVALAFPIGYGLVPVLASLGPLPRVTLAGFVTVVLVASVHYTLHHVRETVVRG